MRRNLCLLALLLMCIPQPVLYARSTGTKPNTQTSAQTASPPANHTAQPPGTSASKTGKAQPQAHPTPPASSVDEGRTANLFALIFALILTYLCCHPVLAFARRGWFIKQADIFSSLNSHAKERYLKTFNFKETSNPDAEFEKIYTFRYGRYRLIVPVILLVLVAFPLIYLEVSSGLAGLVVETGQGPRSLAALLEPGSPLLSLPIVAGAAAAGAFVWVAANLADGAARYNLPPQTVLGAALRLAVAVPLGYAVQSIAAPSIAPFIAFAIGAFPLGEVQIMLKRIATSKLGLEASADHQKDEVHMLDGIDQPTADRLEDGDILTIAQLAYCDPVQLSMRTNLSFTSIIDAQSQALAWIYLGDNLPQLFNVGFRGSIEIGHYVRRLAAEADENGPEHKLLQVASARTAVGPNQTARAPIDPLGLRHAFEEIGGDPYTEFLSDVWASTRENEREPIMDFQPCADCSIDAFAKTLGDPYYPNWYKLVPCDKTNGWGAPSADWHTQAAGIIAAFEQCAGVHIGYNPTEVDNLGQMTLSDFAEYLIEKAEESAAQLVAKIAAGQLDATRERHQETGIRARANLGQPR